ncbi:hypothetical protein [Streptomyces sp. NPDC015345]|uniref:hypothetical protein n=1 Tax=Streptomyces sp. NPDC015345 TaxID=3364953 RepID=UPI0036F8076C
MRSTAVILAGQPKVAFGPAEQVLITVFGAQLDDAEQRRVDRVSIVSEVKGTF